MEFLVPNGIVYPMPAKNPITKSGNERIEISWERGVDPKVVKARIFWNNYTDSVEVAVDPKKDVISHIIGPKNPEIAENTYSFLIHTYDSLGNVSIPVEVRGRVYGKLYERSLRNRAIKSTGFDGIDVVTLYWYGAEKTEAGVKLSYSDIDGKTQTYMVEPSETETTLTNFDIDKPLFLCTEFLPDTTAIDKFYAQNESTMIEPFIPRNTWTVTASSQLSAVFTAAHAIDGDLSTCWHTSEIAQYPHWIAFNMQRPVDVRRVSLTMRSLFPQMTLKDFMIQGSMDGVTWTDYPPSDAQYYNFKPLAEVKQTFDLQNISQMQHIRIRAITAHENTYCVIAEFEVIGVFSK